MKDIFDIKFNSNAPTFLYASINVNTEVVSHLYGESIEHKQSEARVSGFSEGKAPVAYIEATYGKVILSHMKNFLLSHGIMPFLNFELIKNRLPIIGLPEPISYVVEPKKAVFDFQMSRSLCSLQEDWYKISFKIPGRKNYRDLDKQVEFFLKEETNKINSPQEINFDDWIFYSVQPLTKMKVPLLGSHMRKFWIKMSDEETDEEIQQIFLHKKVGDSFFVQTPFLYQNFEEVSEFPYLCKIVILGHIPHRSFCLNLFKNHFKLKNERDIHTKLIEVFSYRHDISQRRETVEAALKTMLKNHHIPIEQEYIIEQKASILRNIHQNPDYYVYKSQPDFKEKIVVLAEKQLREIVLIDTVAYYENITIDEDDIKGYFNLMKRSRTKSFIYFSLPLSSLPEREEPISQEIVYQQCLREKTLNVIIDRLSQQK